MSRRSRPKPRTAFQGKHAKKKGQPMQLAIAQAVSTSPAQVLVAWIQDRRSQNSEFTKQEVVELLGSEELATAGILAAVRCGLITEKLEKYTDTVAPGLSTAGQAEMPESGAPGSGTTLISMASSTEPRGIKVHKGSQDLRARQVAHILGDRAPKILALGSKSYSGSEAALRTGAEGTAGALPANGTVPASGNGCSMYTTASQWYTKEEKEEHNNTTSSSNSLNHKKYIINNISPRPRTRSTQRASLQNAILGNQSRHVIARAANACANPDALRVYGMAVAYEECLGVYLRQPTLRYLTKAAVIVPGSRHFNVWLKAANVADSLGVSYDQFVKAQFWWFDKAFSKHPRPHQLSSSTSRINALERFRAYADAVQCGTLDDTRKVLGRAVETFDSTSVKGRQRSSKISREVRFTNSERQLAVFMKNYRATEDWVLGTFAKGPVAGQYFDLEWLKQHPAYQRLKAAGKL